MKDSVSMPRAELNQLQRRMRALEADNERLREAADSSRASLAARAADESERDRAISTNARVAAIVSTSPDAIISFSPDGVIQSWNRAAAGLFGYSADEAIGAAADLLVPPGCPEGANGVFDWALAGRDVRIESIRLHKDGTPIDVWVSAAPMRTDDGSIIGVSAIMRDIRERKRAEQDQQLLINELNHRVKNSLATIQAIAMQTLPAAPDPAAAHDAFRDRLLALSKAHDLLTKRNWQDVPLRDLLMEELTLHSVDETARVHVDGSEVRLRPNSAIMLGIAFHEMAANAAKHGALSVPEGQVHVRWSICGTKDDGRLCLTWAESEGPPVSLPRHRGFGRRLIERGIAHEFGGDVRLRFDPAGLRCEINAPLRGVRE